MNTQEYTLSLTGHKPITGYMTNTPCPNCGNGKKYIMRLDNGTSELICMAYGDLNSLGIPCIIPGCGYKWGRVISCKIVE